MVLSDNDVTDSLILCNKVYQSNPLIGARKNFDLIGMKIFLLGLQGLNPHFSLQDKIFDKKFKEFLVPATKIKEVFGNNWYLYGIKSACKKLFNSTITIDNPNGVIELRHLFRRLEYVPSEGLYIWFDDILRPYVLDLLDTQGFTQVDGAVLLKLSSPYAIRLLELMLQYRNFEKFKIRREIKRTFKLSELRFMLNVPEGAYQGRLNNFKKFVLENPIREINERTNYKISFQPIKAGRQVVGFEFKLDTKLVPNFGNNERRAPLIHEAIKALKSLGFTEKVAFAIFGKCIDADDCFSRINRAQALLVRSKTPIRNREGFLRKAIEQDWRVYGNKRKAHDFANDKTSVKSSSTMSIAEVFAPILEAMRRATPPEEKNDDDYYVPLDEEPNKYNIRSDILQDIRDWLNAGKDLETAEMLLSSYGLTVEQFKKEFM
ncbi:MAG: replication initiation protein [Selenomonadaceae bacterium]|nr:replication initiation protein [Selenomonadaceae bacterium]